MIKIRYKGNRIVIKHVQYIEKYYCTKINGVIVIFINSQIGPVEHSKILHKIIKTQIRI